ncbi:hypothetical protein, partial [Stenotrophomonas maltophilia]|uniref:hypothetical protein n=1 Tax=Stenotrophomonas maltophilia TaxID=40324 RepID=UPI00195472D4
IEPILYPLAEQDVIALVNSVIKVVTDQEWKLRDGASFHVGEFYAIGFENMVHTLETGRRANFPGQLS